MTTQFHTKNRKKNFQRLILVRQTEKQTSKKNQKNSQTDREYFIEPLLRRTLTSKKNNLQQTKTLLYMTIG